jgi:quercetin dioxygenase-like cupin family protein
MRTSGHFELAHLPLEQLNESTARRLVVGSRVMLQLVSIKAGSRPPAHSHPHEQLIWITSGRMQFRLGDQPPGDCGPGGIVVIPGGVQHETWFPEDTELIEIFGPVREDLLPKG